MMLHSSEHFTHALVSQGNKKLRIRWNRRLTGVFSITQIKTEVSNSFVVPAFSTDATEQQVLLRIRAHIFDKAKLGRHL